MISMIEKAAVIAMAKQGKSPRAIAKELGISRNTARKYLRGFRAAMEAIDAEGDEARVASEQRIALSPPRMDVSGRRPTVWKGDLERRFGELIAEDRRRDEAIGSNKQHLTASLLWRALRKEGFEVGESTVRAHFAKATAKADEAFVRQRYGYGETVDFDFHEVKLIVGGKAVRMHQTTISCPASNYVFVTLQPDERRRSVMRGLIAFFRFAGGVWKEVVFDNLKAVVVSFGTRNAKVISEEMQRFSAYYGFAIKTCNPRRGNEKGHVENSGKNRRAELFSLRWEFADMKELGEYVERANEEANSKAAGAFSEERAHLIPLPTHDYSLADFGTARASKYSAICVMGDFYSVPDRLVGEEISWTVVNGTVIAYSPDGAECARHRVGAGSGEYILSWEHYVSTFRRKPGSMARSEAMLSAPADVRRVFEDECGSDPKAFLALVAGAAEPPKPGPAVETACAAQLRGINDAFGIGRAARWR